MVSQQKLVAEKLTQQELDGKTVLVLERTPKTLSRKSVA